VWERLVSHYGEDAAFTEGINYLQHRVLYSSHPTLSQNNSADVLITVVRDATDAT
jgi:hypothetical protein